MLKIWGCKTSEQVNKNNSDHCSDLYLKMLVSIIILNILWRMADSDIDDTKSIHKLVPISKAYFNNLQTKFRFHRTLCYYKYCFLYLFLLLYFFIEFNFIILINNNPFTKHNVSFAWSVAVSFLIIPLALKY